jgi:hypothetical protein
LNDKPSTTIKRNLRVTYAKKEREIKGNVAGAKKRIQHRKKKSSAPTGKAVEGSRAKKDKSGGSGFKMGKKRGKMRLVETNS